ncbi:MAG: hypothetical protein HRT71_00290 [Flavobacteriales bacterium]|nr:hypothetical protein [Flavobacteriales bacterium]
MKDQQYIINIPAPLSQNFKGLKKIGLEYVQEYSGNEWTNYNSSDPGITILDQVCYALTELGYCNNFPVRDILTNKDGELEFENQFFTPEQILTTSPITILDYRKYLIDGIEAIENVVFETVNSQISAISYAYRVHLSIDPAIMEGDGNQPAVTDPGDPSVQQKSTQVNQICQEAFFLLNKSRNLGEIFLMPQPLKSKASNLFGAIEIDQVGNAEKILTAIREGLEEFVFPRVMQNGYQLLSDYGVETNQIFNGPILKNGWINNADLQDKNNTINVEEIIVLIAELPGVVNVNELSFGQSPSITELDAKQNELLVFDLVDSITSKNLIITCQGKNVYASTGYNEKVNIAPRKIHAKDIGASIQIQPDLPTGNYREINSYYSIQNTFPEVFAVGDSTLESNATPFQIAQSKQLKGYLTLFDQQLANQFSQLANIPNLFSFVNTISGGPNQQAIATNKKGKKKNANLNTEYPVPYLQFSPTYFYQSLYEIPHIKPLLKNNDTFDFSLNNVSATQLEKNSWSKYKNDPYNGYIWGLMQIMEDEDIGLDRRNKILDHLLARHGESPMLIDSIIDDTIYTGDAIKGKLIFKSLLLQNIGVLSYYRCKAFNYLGADPISSTLPELPSPINADWLSAYNVDFVFDSEKIDSIELISSIDFTNYSALELKLSLLFGLNPLYKNYIVETSEALQTATTNTAIPNGELNLQLALWMIQERKGAIVIEPNLLLQSLSFKIAYCEINEVGAAPVYHSIKENIDYHSAIGIEQLFREDLQTPNGTLNKETVIQVGDKSFSVLSVPTCDWAKGLWQTIPGTNNQIALQANSDSSSGSSTIDLTHSIFQNANMIFLPEFIPQFTQPNFTDRINLLLESTQPVHITTSVNIIKRDELNELIPLFCKWRNNLRGVPIANAAPTPSADSATSINPTTSTVSGVDVSDVESSAVELIAAIIKIQTNGND